MKVPTILLVTMAGLVPIFLVASLILLPSVGIISWQPPNNWSSQFGPSGYGNAITTVFATPNDLYVGGYTGYPLYGANSSIAGAIVARYDQDGHQIWSRTFGDPSSSEVVAVGAGPDAVIGAGQLNGRAFVRAYDPNGTELWTRFPGGGEIGSRVFDAISGNKTIDVAWEFSAANGSSIDEVQTYDLQGNTLWNFSMGQDSTGGRSVNLHGSPDGPFASSSDATTGHGYLQHYDPSGILKWTTLLDCASCFITGFSGDGIALYLSGYLVGPTGGSTFFLAKYDLMGNKVWSNQMLDLTFSLPHLWADPSGVYMALEGTSSHPGVIRKYDGSGGQEWSIETKTSLDSVSAGGNSVFVGGSTNRISPAPGGTGAGFGYVAGFWQSSSLILFGLNPPFSFGLAAGIAIAVVGGLLWHRRRWLFELRQRSRKPQETLKGVPRDAFVFV